MERSLRNLSISSNARSVTSSDVTCSKLRLVAKLLSLTRFARWASNKPCTVPCSRCMAISASSCASVRSSFLESCRALVSSITSISRLPSLSRYCTRNLISNIVNVESVSFKMLANSVGLRRLSPSSSSTLKPMLPIELLYLRPRKKSITRSRLVLTILSSFLRISSTIAFICPVPPARRGFTGDKLKFLVKTFTSKPSKALRPSSAGPLLVAGRGTRRARVMGFAVDVCAGVEARTLSIASPASFNLCFILIAARSLL
mmetsp:Transcript_31025/g.82264  ORF Transcript_31025/g.82264 Transcript_31025/m.82264 type:complete len:259 (+) Transcript_31025:597-1373(+)